MTDQTDTDGSEPCFAHRLVDGHVVDLQAWRDVAAFRKAERQRLYALRKAVALDDRKAMAENIARQLDERLPGKAGRIIAVYWPIRGELDLRGWMASAHAHGAMIALPVVIEKDQPVEFHSWTPDTPMRLGTWRIPVPETPRPVTPDTVIVPLLGVDAQNYRLGNGGGYYDRTLARLPSGTRTIGVGQDFCMMRTIYPMPWDIAMKEIVLGSGPDGTSSPR